MIVSVSDESGSVLSVCASYPSERLSPSVSEKRGLVLNKSFLIIGQAIFVRINSAWIGALRDFVAVAEGVAIGVGQVGVGVVDVNFSEIAQAVIVNVGWCIEDGDEGGAFRQ